MDADKTIIWHELEYKEKERSTDWFWALGVIAVASAVASIIFKDYLFAVFIILAALVLGFYAIRKPRLVEFKIDAKGLAVGREFYPYDRLTSFFILEKENGEKLLLVMSKRSVVPLLVLPLGVQNAEEVRQALIARIPEEKHEEPTSHKVMEYLGF